MTPLAQRHRPRLQLIIAALRKEHGAPQPPPTNSAFELILWERIGYLVNDETRNAAFEKLRTLVGLTPRAILGAKRSVLDKIAALGGEVGVIKRAEDMLDAAAIVEDDFAGNLDAALALPLAAAKRALERFAGIGEPGAERILMLQKAYPLLALDSNGLRTLRRIGYGSERRSYSQTYRSVRDAVTPELSADPQWLIDTHLLLRRHGQLVCKASRPLCPACVVRELCDTGRKS
jgi:endonuclease III